MKITSIKAQNFIGAIDVDLKISRPITLVCGHTHSGKSSVQEAVRMALTGESVRVALKKDYRKLVTDEADVGYCVVEHDGQRSAITLPNGAHEHTGGPTPSVIPFVLDAQRFSSLPANERRSFLFGLTGLRTDGDTVSARLLDKGCDPLKVDEIRPHLRAGFEAAHKEAQSFARDSKAAWRTITGETYGSVKAATWAAQKPAHDATALRLAREELSSIEQQIEDGARRLGDMQGQARTQAEQSARLAGLRQQAALFSRAEAKLKKDQGELAEWQTKVEHEARRGVGKQLPAEPTYTCPLCAAQLRHDHASGALVVFTPPPVVDQTTEPSRLSEYQRARDLLAKSVENDKRDLADADRAAKTLAEIEKANVDPAPAPEEIAAAKTIVEAKKKSRPSLQDAIRALEQDERSAMQADSKTSAAASHHADVAQWEAIADALAPGGIPGEMLAEALGPINDRLGKSALETGWRRARIESDMTLTADGRIYGLLSESERWMADAQIAEAISHLSGVKLLMLDRVDVLFPSEREDVLYWLDDLAEKGEIDSALLFATLKKLPAVSGNIGSFWIENGVAKPINEVE